MNELTSEQLDEIRQRMQTCGIFGPIFVERLMANKTGGKPEFWRAFATRLIWQEQERGKIKYAGNGQYEAVKADGNQ